MGAILCCRKFMQRIVRDVVRTRDKREIARVDNATARLDYMTGFFSSKIFLTSSL